VAGVLELRLPSDALADDAAALPELLAEVDARCQRHEAGTLTPFYEMPLQANWTEQIPVAARALRQFNQARTGQQPHAGFKLRCGGLEKSAFPSVEQVALCLHECLTWAIPFKATAGLHHPLRRFDPGLQATMHGFINVFGGAVLAAVQQFETKRLAEVLADEQSGHFRFADASFRWMDCEVSADDIARLRTSVLTSFGSCSFDEPRDDLRSLGWL
jgi:hypothetical protein